MTTAPDRNAIARARLDERLQPLRQWATEPRPHRGWVRAIRDALGMSGAELAARLGVTPQSVSDLERSEERRTVTLETLRRAANALDCDLVYVLVPRRGLEDAVQAQARRKAAQHLSQVVHHSRLENQMISERDTQAQLDALAPRWVDRRGLWTEPPRDESEPGYSVS